LWDDQLHILGCSLLHHFYYGNIQMIGLSAKAAEEILLTPLKKASLVYQFNLLSNKPIFAMEE